MAKSERRYSLEPGDMFAVEASIPLPIGYIEVQVLATAEFPDGTPALLVGIEQQGKIVSFPVPDRIVQQGGVAEGVDGMVWRFPAPKRHGEYLSRARSNSLGNRLGKLLRRFVPNRMDR